MKLKQCRGCRKKWPLNFYATVRDRRSGGSRLESRCIPCERQRKRDYYWENRENLLKIQRKYQEENRDYFREYNKRYRQMKKGVDGEQR